MPDSPRTRFLAKLDAGLRAGAFVKLTLSEYRGAEQGVRNLYARPVELRDGPHLSLVWRYATRDVTKNVPVREAADALGKLLGAAFSRAHLFTTTGDWQLHCDAEGAGKLKASRPVFAVAPMPEHDQKKRPSLTVEHAPFLRALGVTSATGEARPGMADKLRQIQRFVEILGHLVDDSPLRDRRELRVLDMGAGKGYLTFATAAFFRESGVDAEVVGVEARTDLVELTNRVARETGFARLRFEHRAIGDFAGENGAADLLIALHACDTATDDALHHGIRAGASLILAAPCCHQEIRAQLTPPPVLREVLRHGILAEREAEIVTDGIRALLLEIHGYKASVFEFISSEHTGKNLMIAAHKRLQPPDPAPLRERLRALLAFYGLRSPRLAQLLGE
ncbi:MAG: SAM-dependent methyltransferase [Chthoniobacter sp.]|nr:SAM-dependent methyltransferase [Chthoniobacter sp.]